MRISTKAALVLTCISLTASAQEAAQEAPAPVIPGKFLKSADAIPGQYIVVLKDAQVAAARVPEKARALAARHGGKVFRTYSHALRGFATTMSEASARALAASPEVDYVVEDGHAYGSASQSSPPWGLDRVDQRDRPLDSTYNYNATGNGVHVYIIDSGIRTTHTEFGTRATGDFTAINDGWGTGDCHGHGTHVAGTVGGATSGVAKDVRLHSVRVLGCDNRGAWSGIIEGIDWVTANHINPAVANMSLGGEANQAVDDAVVRSINSGVFYAVSAGNETTDACTRSPARAPAVLTVGATDSTDTRASWSNSGTCVDIFAPGVNVTSASHTSNTGSTTMSGTSMAAPHVSGVAALYLESRPAASPGAVTSAILQGSSGDKVVNAGGSPNRLLFSQISEPFACGTLFADQGLAPGHSLLSCSGNAELVHQGDGNVVVYDRLGALWASDTGGSTAAFVMQGDGNLVLYANPWHPIWASDTDGNLGSYMRIQDDCNLVVYSSTGQPLWATNRYCR